MLALVRKMALNCNTHDEAANQNLRLFASNLNKTRHSFYLVGKRLSDVAAASLLQGAADTAAAAAEIERPGKS